VRIYVQYTHKSTSINICTYMWIYAMYTKAHQPKDIYIHICICIYAIYTKENQPICIYTHIHIHIYTRYTHKSTNLKIQQTHKYIHAICTPSEHQTLESDSLNPQTLESDTRMR